MSKLEKLAQLDSASARDFIKQKMNDDDFIQEVVDRKETLVPVLLKHKFFPDGVISKLSQNKEDSLFLLSQFIENKYIPNIGFIEKLISFGESVDLRVLEAVKAFPSLPMNVPFVMLLINSGLVKTLTEVVKSKTEFHKAEIIVLILKTGTEDVDFIKIALANQEVIDLVVNDVNENDTVAVYSSFLINELIKKPALIQFSKALEFGLTAEAYEKLLASHALEVASQRTTRNYRNIYGYGYSKPSVIWNAEIEKVDPNLFREMIVSQAPVGSKFRKQWLMSDPVSASNEEIVELFNENSVNSVVCRNLLQRPINIMKMVDLEKIANHLPPALVADTISGNKEKALYLLKELSSKYRPSLRKLVPLSEIPADENKRKRSYFFEAFEAIRKNNVDEFRLALSNGYDFNKFIEDTKQSSKNRSCELARISAEFASKLEKQELLGLLNTKFDFFGYCSEKINFPFKLTIEEAFILNAKTSIGTAFDACEDQSGFISAIGKSSEVSTLFSSRSEEILGNKKLLVSYLNKSKSYQVDLDSDSVKQLAKILSSEELSKVINLNTEMLHYCVDVKCADGKFLLSDSKIFELLSDRYTLESSSFLEGLINRDINLAERIINAYLAGNKGLSALCGKQISIRRGCIKMYKAVLKELKTGKESIVDDIFLRGGILQDFVENLNDWKTSLVKYANGRVVNVPTIEFHRLCDLTELPTIKFKVAKLTLGYSFHYHSMDETIAEMNFDNIKMDSLYLEGGFKACPVNLILSILKKANIATVNADETGFSTKLSLVMNSIPFNGATSIFNNVTENTIENLNSLSIEQLKFLESNGLIFSKKFIEETIGHYSGNDQVISWLSSRVGGLHSFIIAEGEIKYQSGEAIEALEKSGIKIVPDSEVMLMKIEENLSAQGANFEPVNIEKFSLKQKAKIIRFIEDKIDPNYSKLNLTTINLETVESLNSYEVMRTIYSLDDEDAVRLFLISDNVAKNKKMMKGIKDLLSLTGGGIAYKVQLFKQVMEKLNPQADLSVADFLDYSNQTTVIESESFKAISLGALKTLESFGSLIVSQGIILKNKSKAEIVRFLRSSSAKEESHLRDTLQMIESVLRGVDALKERVVALSSDEDGSVHLQDLNNTIDSVTTRLSEVAAMDSVEHMHDRLIPLLSFIQSDPVQPLGQDKYRKFENSKELDKELGYKLFFPKTRGDLSYLGDENGWCVNNHSTYGDNIINKGNILVGLCEPGTESSKENVIALAHFLKQEKGYQLEQLKWSSKKKNGSRNVDATKDFKSAAILGTITKYLENYEKNKKVK